MRLVRLMTKWLLWLAATPALAVCGHLPVTDWGLHRQWRVECDATHPERPARLIEVPWNSAGQVEQQQETKIAAAAEHPPILIHAATRVEVLAGSPGSVMYLNGTSLEAGAMRAVIRVRAEWNGAVLRCVVRGPGVVELLPRPRKAPR